MDTSMHGRGQNVDWDHPPDPGTDRVNPDRVDPYRVATDKHARRCPISPGVTLADIDADRRRLYAPMVDAWAQVQRDWARDAQS